MNIKVTLNAENEQIFIRLSHQELSFAIQYLLETGLHLYDKNSCKSDIWGRVETDNLFVFYPFFISAGDERAVSHYRSELASLVKSLTNTPMTAE